MNMTGKFGLILSGKCIRNFNIPSLNTGLSVFGGVRVCRRLRSVGTTAQQGDDDAAQLNYDTRVDLAAVYRSLQNYNLHEGVCNHLTAKAPRRDGSGGTIMLVIPYGIHWKEVTASMLLGVDMKTGEVVEGDQEPEISAFEIHRAIHTARPDIKVSFHVHPPYLTALGLLKDPEILMAHQNVIPYYKDIAYDTDFDGFGTSSDEGQRLASVLGNKSVLMMCNHGVLCVSDNAARGFDMIYYLERCAMFQVLAMSTGREIKILSKDLLERVKKESDVIQQTYHDAHFNCVKHTLLKEEPDYRT